MTRLSGRVPETGTAIQGATVAIIDTQGVEDASQWSVIAFDTTDANGEWSVSGLDASAVERYHAVAQYDDGSSFTNFESLPYLSTPADVFAPETALTVGTPTPTVEVASAIPDEEDLHAHFDATEITANDGDSVTTWTDQSGNGYDLTAGNAPTLKTGQVNGNPVVRFDGSNDYLDVTFNELSQPNSIFVVYQIQATSNSSDSAVYDGESSRQAFYWNGSGGRAIYAGGSEVTGGNPDQNPHISSAFFNGADSYFRIDGTQDASGDAGSDGLNGLLLGALNGPTNHLAVDICELLVYPQDKSGIQSDVESYLSDKWGIAV